jgi:hypothetical protein
MNKKNLLRRIGGIILATSLLSGIAMMSVSTVQAQGRHGRRVIIVRPYRPFYPYRWYGYPYYGDPYYGYYSQYVFSNSETAVNQGYHDGFDTGRKDGKKAKSYDPQRSHYFHDAGFGNFAEAYRSGFSRGYRDGYSAGRNG